MIFDKEAFEAEYAGKRGVRPNWHYLEIALDNLENLYIEYYSETSYNRNADAKTKKERQRRRNEISALESRFKKKL